MDCSSVTITNQFFVECAAFSSRDFSGERRNEGIGIIAPKLQSIYMRYPEKDDFRTTATAIRLESTPSVVELNSLKSIEFYGSFRRKVAVRVAPTTPPNSLLMSSEQLERSNYEMASGLQAFTGA